MVCVRSRWIRILALAVACVVGMASWSRPAVADDPCGTIPNDETWRFVMVVDGSGSMGGLWGDMVTAIKSQIATLPDDAELEIVVFSSEARLRGSRASLETWTNPLDARSRADAMRWVDRRRPGGQTPLYHTLQQVLTAQEAWLREDPRRRSTHVFIYTDGDDNPGFDSGGRETDTGQVTKADVQAVIDRITRMEMNLGVRFEGKEIALGGHRGAGFRDIELIRQLRGQKIPIPVAVALGFASPQLPPVRGGGTSGSLRVKVQCPQFLGGARVRLSGATDQGLPIAVEPAEFPLGNEEVELTLRPRGDADRLRDGFDAVLTVDYVGGDPNHPISGPRTIRFGVAAEERIDLDPGAIQVRPGVVLRGKPVSLEYLRPLADAIPRWSREDGGQVLGGDQWSASTTFEEEGDAVVTLEASRGDLVSEPIEIVIPVRDITLRLDRIGDGPLSVGDQATFEVEATGLAPVGFEWQVDGRPLLGEDGARVQAVFQQPGTSVVRARGRLDLGGGGPAFTDWVSASVQVEVRPAVFVRAPFKEPWGRPIEVQVLVDGDIERVRCSVIDPATSSMVGDPLDAPVQTKALNEGKGTDRVADFMLPIPERSGRFLIRAEAVGRDGIVDDAEIELTTPTLAVTLDDPPPIDRITVGQPRRFRISLGDRAAAVIKQVDWAVTGVGGRVLPIEGIDEPAAPDGRGLRVAEFDVLLPDDGSIADGEALRIEPVFTTARGVRLAPEGSSPAWTLTAGYPATERRIVGGDGADVAWGDSVVFSVEPADRVVSVDWSIDGPGTTPTGAVRTEQFEAEFDGQPGEYRIRASVRTDIPNAPEVVLETTRTVTIQPIEANVEFPAGRAGRGEHVFPALVSASGSIRSAELVFTRTTVDGSVSDRVPVEFKRGSSFQEVETSSPAFGPDAMGVVTVALEIERPDGRREMLEFGELVHKSPPVWWAFGLLALVAVGFLYLTGRLMTGNRHRNARLMRAALVGDEGDDRSLEPPGWSWWRKGFLFRLDQIHQGEDDEPALEWMSDPDLQGTIRLRGAEKGRGTKGVMVPIWDPDNPDAIEAARVDEGLILEPLGIGGAPVRLHFRERSRWPFPGVLSLLWLVLLAMTLVGLLRAMEWLIL